MALHILKGPGIIRPFQQPTTLYIEHPSGMRVEMIDQMGDDLAIVNAARVSYGKESQYQSWHWNDCLGIYTKEGHLCHSHDVWMPDVSPPLWEHRLAPADLGVLGYMMRERHGSPFEMVDFKFRIKAPIKVVWEWVRHRISSFNIMSTRYVEWDKDYYVPEAEEWRRQIGKPGRYTTEQITDPDHVRELEIAYVAAMESAFEFYGILVNGGHHIGTDVYTRGGLHKEVAANILPMGAMTEMIWKVNLRSLFNFLSLRTDSHALQEIQICANMVEALAETIVPESFKLWRENEKHTP